MEIRRETRRDTLSAAWQNTNFEELTRKWIVRSDWNLTPTEAESRSGCFFFKVIFQNPFNFFLTLKPLQPVSALTSAVDSTLPRLSRRFRNEDDVLGSRIHQRVAPWHSLGVWVLLKAGNRLFRSVNTSLYLATFGLPVAREARDDGQLGAWEALRTQGRKRGDSARTRVYN